MWITGASIFSTFVVSVVFIGIYVFNNTIFSIDALFIETTSQFPKTVRASLVSMFVMIILMGTIIVAVMGTALYKIRNHLQNGSGAPFNDNLLFSHILMVFCLFPPAIILGNSLLMAAYTTKCAVFTTAVTSLYRCLITFDVFLPIA